MISETVVELSRWQFAITAMFHFLFVPLTLGLSVFLALMESAYVLSGQRVYQNACRFWSRIFAINFTLGVATRLVMIFQFGINGSYFSHYVGDIFALPLAIEALSTFFLASVLFGPLLSGWERFDKHQHLLITWLIAIAVNGSALWVLIANGWMQNPVGAAFNYQSYRMELTDFAQLLTNPVAADKALHTIAAAYATAAATVLAVSAWLLLKNRDDDMARHSYRFAAVIGLVAAVLLVALGDDTPDLNNPVQNRKLAALSGQDVNALLPDIETRIRSGIIAYRLLQDLRDDDKNPALRAEFDSHKADLGYGLLLKRWKEEVVNAGEVHIKLAAQSALPKQPALLFLIYRLMIAFGIVTLLLFALASLLGKKRPIWLLQLSLYLAPLPWLACIGGWFIAEAGQQPWAIAEVLPTFLSVSSLSVKELSFSLIAYLIAYAALFFAGLALMRQTLQNHRPGKLKKGAAL